MATGEDSSHSDENLMITYQNGSDVGFAHLVKRRSAQVYGFLVKQLKSRSDADDILQATLLKVHNSRGHFDPGSS